MAIFSWHRSSNSWLVAGACACCLFCLLFDCPALFGKTAEEWAMSWWPHSFCCARWLLPWPLCCWSSRNGRLSSGHELNWRSNSWISERPFSSSFPCCLQGWHSVALAHTHGVSARWRSSSPGIQGRKNWSLQPESKLYIALPSQMFRFSSRCFKRLMTFPCSFTSFFCERRADWDGWRAIKGWCLSLCTRRPDTSGNDTTCYNPLP